MSGGSQFAPAQAQASQGNSMQVNSSNFWDHLTYLRGGSPRDAAIVNLLIQPVPVETQSEHHSSELESRGQGQLSRSSDRYGAGSYNTPGPGPGPGPERPSSKYNNYYDPDSPAQTINGLNSLNQSQSSNNTIPSPNTSTSASYNYHNSLPPVREITCPSCGHNLGSIDSISKPVPVPGPGPVVTNENHYINNSAAHESSQGTGTGLKSGEWKWVSEPSVISSAWSTTPPPPPPPQTNQFQNTSFFTSPPSKPPRPKDKDEEPPKNPTPYRTNFNPASINSPLPRLNHQLNQNNQQGKRAVNRISDGHGHGPGYYGRGMQGNESHSEKKAGCDAYESQYTSYKPNTAHRTLSELLRFEDNRSSNNTPRPRPRPRPTSNQRENLFLNDWSSGPPGRRQIGHTQPMSIPPVCQAGREESDSNGHGHEPVIQNSRTYLWDQHIVQNMKECWERFLHLRVPGNGNTSSGDDDAAQNSSFQSHHQQQQQQHQQQQRQQKYCAAKSKSNDYNFWELEPEPEPDPAEVRRNRNSVEARSRATWTCHCDCRMRYADQDQEAVQNNQVQENEISFQDFPTPSPSQSRPFHQVQSLKGQGPCPCSAPARSGIKTDTGTRTRHSSLQVKRPFLDIRSEFEAAAAEFIRRQEGRQQINDEDRIGIGIGIEHEKENLSKASEISSEEKVELWMERNSNLGSNCDINSNEGRHGHGKGRGTSTTELQPPRQRQPYAPKSGSTDATRMEILERATATSDLCGSEDYMEDVQEKPNQYFSKSSSSADDHHHQVEMGMADNCIKVGGSSMSRSRSTEVDGCEAESPSRGTGEKRSSTTDTTFLSITDDEHEDRFRLRKSSASGSESLSTSNLSSSSSSQGPPIPPLDDQLGATSESWGWSSWFSSS